MEKEIRKLKDLISDYDDIRNELSEMIEQWKSYDDPMSDPGLQYEKECEAEKAYNKIVEYSKTLNTI